MFALWSDVTNGLAAVVIVQAGIFAEASRQLVKLIPFLFESRRCPKAHETG